MMFNMVPDFLYWFHTFNIGSRLSLLVPNFFITRQYVPLSLTTYSTVTLFAKFRGLSTSWPRASEA